ncbi:hypothetical protein RvY_12888-1 [Ramazzottius varieornatus]|uniref:Tetraspanin n=1 Tax=Ramazzottius varieornatus TaxID=947166 RepID=A0A1D1VKZ7_RAMVA|nr:hypothetical protein RvY_12888-1 [Ramazzottius varieornatus]
MVVHKIKGFSIAFSVLYVMLAVADLAVTISWYVDGVDTGASKMDYQGVLALLISLGVILGAAGMMGCIASLKEALWAAILSTLVVFLTACCFGVIAGYLGTQLIAREAVLRTEMTRELALYAETNDTRLFWDDMHRTYNCCGIDKPEDWLQMSRFQHIPTSCLDQIQNHGHISYQPGCYFESLRKARKAAVSGAATSAVMALILMVGFVFNVIFCLMLKRTRNKHL